MNAFLDNHAWPFFSGGMINTSFDGLTDNTCTFLSCQDVCIKKQNEPCDIPYTIYA